MDKKFSHINTQGDPTMVDVSGKKVTFRTATALTEVWLPEIILEQLQNDEIHTKKGPVFQTAIIAGTQAVKKTSELIPFCHPLGLDDCKINIKIDDSGKVNITCQTKVEAKTGVEMEALTGSTVAALTVYDMCKGLSHDIIIKETKLLEKTGGKSDIKKA